MEEGRELISHRKFDIVTRRLCHELVENYQDFSDACIVGLQPRGTILSDMISHILQTEMGISNIEYGILDITFYRDDYRDRTKVLRASETRMDFIVERKKYCLSMMSYTQAAPSMPQCLHCNTTADQPI